MPDILHADLEVAALFLGSRANISSKDDPALRFAAEQVKKLLVAEDAASATEAMTYTSDLLLSVGQERSPGRQLPSKQQIDDMLQSRKKELVASAEALKSEVRRFEVPFSEAEIVETVAERVYIQSPAGLPELFRADDLRVTLRIPERMGNAGEKLPGGDYVVGIASAERLSGKWYLPKLRWASLPMADQETTKSLQVENHVATFGRLPHGAVAPDIELLSLNPKSDQPVKLSDYRGKFVILEWWATWCGPCQAPMARLQEVRQKHPHWGERVEIVTISLDSSSAAPKKHLQAKGWTNTLNFWAGGDFNSAAAKAFRVTSLPQVYLISTNGTVVNADVEQVDAILKGIQ